MVETSDLRKAGLKVTLPRVKILEILAGNHGRHLSAEDIYRALIEQSEDIGLATVYRVLTQFETAQLVKRHHFEGGTAVFVSDGDLVVESGSNFDVSGGVIDYQSGVIQTSLLVGADVDELKVKTILVEQATSLKRFQARAKGRGNRITKRTCHIFVTVGDEEKKKPSAKQAKK